MTIVVILLGTMSATSSDKGEPAAELPLAAKQSHQTLAVVQSRSGTVRKLPWKSVLGRQVTVQGIAWGDSKGLGDRVILDGTSTYVDIKPALKNRGQLVEVTGTLAKRRVPGAPIGSQGFSQDTEYYVLEDATAKSIEAVSDPYVVVIEK